MFAVPLFKIDEENSRPVDRSTPSRNTAADRPSTVIDDAVPVLRVKLAAFTISGAVAGTAGALYAQLNYSFDVTSYNVGRSVEVFTASIVGGLGSLFGAVLGAAYLRGMEWFVTADEWRFLSTAAGVLFVLLALPGGLGALVVRLRDELARRIEARAGRGGERS